MNLKALFGEFSCMGARIQQHLYRVFKLKIVVYTCVSVAIGATTSTVENDDDNDVDGAGIGFHPLIPK
ncbi:hypothetical protein FF38_07345 [Lucilia cuprina]|uniref:Uncharacterized protein n=1 Tax=Lucilia cuprina TaxID=7375 RepID=A0A0L0C645_LUCCU|nr:hypothetical protein FF38_07345 [Lucilia cuprina]